eukprot:3440444-Rhodomonas_salina.1
MAFQPENRQLMGDIERELDAVHGRSETRQGDFTMHSLKRKTRSAEEGEDVLAARWGIVACVCAGV